MELGTLVSIGILGAFLYWVVWGDWLKPLLFPPPPPAKTVKRLSDKPLPRLRSRGSKPVNAVNARSAQQHAEAQRLNVQPERSSVQAELPKLLPAAAPSGAAAALTLTEKELTQLSVAIALRAKGHTKQEALEEAFDCKKGGGEAWKRASSLFDIAMGG